MKFSSILLFLGVFLPCVFVTVGFADNKGNSVVQTNPLEIHRTAPFLINDTIKNKEFEFEGFLPLFDGKTLNGWVQRGGKAKFTVEDGMIVGATVPKTQNSFLCSEKQYGNFILELDFKVDPAMNSGVQFRGECFDKPTTVKIGDKEIKIPAGRVHGYQYEIDMNPNRIHNGKPRLWTAGVYDEARRGWLYPGALGGDEAAFSEQGAKIGKQNQWNHLRIEAVGDSIKTWLNGVLAADFKDSMTPKGFIALQVHDVGDLPEPLHVYWKNIRIKEVIPENKETEK